jgi:hypothetical protein
VTTNAGRLETDGVFDVFGYVSHDVSNAAWSSFTCHGIRGVLLDQAQMCRAQVSD